MEKLHRMFRVGREEPVQLMPKLRKDELPLRLSVFGPAYCFELGPSISTAK